MSFRGSRINLIMWKHCDNVPVDVWMVDSCGEGKFGRLEGIVRGEVDVEKEDAALEGTVSGPQDCGLPVEWIIA